MQRLKLYQEAGEAIREHRWLASEQAGRDLGADAERHWGQSHWLAFYRARLVRHLRGDSFYEEFGSRCHGAASELGCCSGELLDAVLHLIETGAENLDILRWAFARRVPRDAIIEVLRALDINGHRLQAPFDSAHCACLVTEH